MPEGLTARTRTAIGIESSLAPRRPLRVAGRVASACRRIHISRYATVTASRCCRHLHRMIL